MSRTVLLIATRSITVRKFLLPVVENFTGNLTNVHVVANKSSDLYPLFKSNKELVTLSDIDFPQRWVDLINPFSMFKVISKLRCILKKNRSSIVYIHTPVASHLTRVASLFISNTIVYHVHGFRFHSQGGLFKNTFSMGIEYCLSFLTDKYILINRDDEAIASKWRPSKAFYIPGVGVNIADLSLINNIKLHDKNKLIIIGVVGAYKKEKGYSDVIMLSELLTRFNVAIHCYGSGDPGVFKEILIKKKITNVSFMGFDDNVVHKISKFDLLIHPSRREGLPVSVMEAMCLKVPVIATNIRGCRDLIEDKVSGRLYEPKDINSLFDIVNDFLEHPSHYYLYAKNARKKCVENYDAFKLAKRIYSTVIAE